MRPPQSSRRSRTGAPVMTRQTSHQRWVVAVFTVLVAVSSTGGCRRGDGIPIDGAADTTAVLQHAIASMGDLGSPPRLFDPSASERAGDNWDAQWAQRIATMLGARIVRADSVFNCRGTLPSSCEMRGGNSLTTVERPVFSGTQARISILVRVPSNDPIQPVNSALYDVVLVRTNGRWAIHTRTFITS
jgi:hypothetical protein